LSYAVSKLVLFETRVVERQQSLRYEAHGQEKNSLGGLAPHWRFPNIALWAFFSKRNIFRFH